MFFKCNSLTKSQETITNCLFQRSVMELAVQESPRHEGSLWLSTHRGMSRNFSWSQIRRGHNEPQSQVTTSILGGNLRSEAERCHCKYSRQMLIHGSQTWFKITDAPWPKLKVVWTLWVLMACQAMLSHRPAFDRIYLCGFPELITLSQLLIDGKRIAVE